MSHAHYDVIVVGLGATGGATLFHLARQGARVLGIDQFSVPHARGSSHGHTRIYRQAYYEAPEYVPMAQRALELWHELERYTGYALFANTGALNIGPEHGPLVHGALASARQHDLAYELLSARETTERFPAFTPPSGAVAVFEPTAGVLFVEACLRAHINLARTHGAVLSLDEVVAIESTGPRPRVRTTNAAFEAERVVVAAGAWSPRLLGLERAFHVTRETVHWFATTSPAVRAETCPVSMTEYGDGPILYTLPDFGDGFKAGLHHGGDACDPAAHTTTVSGDDTAAVLAQLQKYVPGGAGPLKSASPCYYTTTQDHHFAVGELPSHPGVILASACSGHGFKFAPALGESVAALALGMPHGLPVSLFDVARL